jgi:hypothetical protein
MRRRTFGTLAAMTVLVAGCGSSSHFANQPRPASPIALTVYVNNDRVSISPTSAGAGQVVFIVTNQASNAESVTVHHQGNSTRLATTGPINPQATAQVTVDLKSGDYLVATSSGGASEAALATGPKIQPAALHIGPPRPSSSNQLLQP